MAVAMSLSIFLSGAVLGQPAASAPVFDIADVQVTPPDAPTRGGGVLSQGRFEVRGETLLQFISRAYGIPDDRILGGPAWLDTDRFDVFATAAPGVLSASLRPMLQALLADRFRLAAHADTRPVPVYALVAGARPLLKESPGTGEAGCTGTSSGTASVLSCHNMTMEGTAAKLTEVAGLDLDRPLVDFTGLHGAYDFTLRWTARTLMLRARVNDPDAGTGTSLLAAVEKQLGLKTEIREQSMPVLVVDRVNRTPSDAAPGRRTFPKTFEVAELRSSIPDAPVSANITGDRFEYRGITLRRMLALAYNVSEDWIAGEQKWLDTDKFDTIAKAASIVPSEVLRAMFRTLILERFQLAFHMEERPVPVFALTVAKHPPKLGAGDPTKRGQCKVTLGDGARVYSCRNTTMEQLAQKVRLVQTNTFNLPVVDLTDLTGAYDFTFSYDPAGRITNEPTDTAPTGYLPFLDAMERDTGLKIARRMYPRRIMVIDRAERAPVEK
jgi:uncharacterized protein (TIGR03435 family)